MPRFSVDDKRTAQPVDRAMMSATSEDDFRRQIDTDPDTAPDLGDTPVREFSVRHPAPDVRALRI